MYKTVIRAYVIIGSNASQTGGEFHNVDARKSGMFIIGIAKFHSNDQINDSHDHCPHGNGSNSNRRRHDPTLMSLLITSGSIQV